MTNLSILQNLRELSAGDRMLLKALVSCAMATLSLGVFAALRELSLRARRVSH